MPKTRQTKATLIERVVFLSVIGALALPKITNFFVQTVSELERNPPCLDEHRAEPLIKKNEQVGTRRSSEKAETLRPAKSRALAPSLPRRASSPIDATTALSVTPPHRLQIAGQDLTLGEEGRSRPWKKQNAQEQYFQEIATMEEMLRLDFDPTAVPQDLTAEEVAAIEAEMQEKILQEEAPGQ